MPDSNQEKGSGMHGGAHFFLLFSRFSSKIRVAMYVDGNPLLLCLLIEQSNLEVSFSYIFFEI